MGSLTYHSLIGAAALRVNALEGTDPVELEQVYSTRPLTDELFDSSIIPFSDFVAGCGWAEGKIAEVAAETGNNPLRAYILSETDPLTSGALMPSTDTNGTGIIGIYGSVMDGADTNIICTEGTLEQIRRFNQLKALGSSVFLLNPYQYKLDGNGIVHTQTTVVVQVCVYDGATQANAIQFDQTILFPDSLAEAYISGMLSYAMRDDEFMPQAGAYRQYFDATLQGIRGGLTSVPSIATAGPTMTVGAT